MMSREEKEVLMSQRGVMIWFTGLSGSGKSTLALGVERELYKLGIKSQILDGDNIRNGINADLGFSVSDRTENIRRIAEIGKLFVGAGLVTLACFVSPTQEIRNLARNIIGEQDFKEIYVSTSLEECERRDVKGLYAKARRGELKDFTGISSVFETPTCPTLSINTSELSLQECVRQVVALIMQHCALSM